MTSFLNEALNLTIFSAWAGVGATNHAQVSLIFFWTPVISSSCLRLKLSSSTSLNNLCLDTYARDGLLIMTERRLFLATVL